MERSAEGSREAKEEDGKKEKDGTEKEGMEVWETCIVAVREAKEERQAVARQVQCPKCGEERLSTDCKCRYTGKGQLEMDTEAGGAKEEEGKEGKKGKRKGSRKSPCCACRGAAGKCVSCVCAKEGKRCEEGCRATACGNKEEKGNKEEEEFVAKWQGVLPGELVRELWKAQMQLRGLAAQVEGLATAAKGKEQEEQRVAMTVNQACKRIIGLEKEMARCREEMGRRRP